jgi:hypothetical protein
LEGSSREFSSYVTTPVPTLQPKTQFSTRMKHLEVRHHFLRDHVEKGDIEMRYIDTERQLANIFIKPLDASHFTALRGENGVYHPHGLI